MSRSIAGGWARCRPHRLLFGVAVIVGSYGIGTVTAGVIRHDVPDAQYRSLAAQPQFDPVAYLVDRASAVVIDPRWILMAGHTITNAANSGLNNLTFDVKGTVYTSLELIRHPGFSGTSGTFDIGLARLAAPVSGIVPATRYRGSSELGQVGTIVGFGRTGTGLSGEIDGSHGTKRAGKNVIDVFGPTVGEPAYTVWADFDSPLNPAQSSWGSAEPLPLEYCPASGDSGSGLFIDVAGQPQLAGVFRVVRNWPTQGDQILANYGDIIGFTLVSPFNEWIDETISTPTAYWSNAAGGSFASAQNWVDAIAPGANHTAVFNIARTYSVALADQTVNQRLRVRAGNVTIDLAGNAYSLGSSPLEPSLIVGKSVGDAAQLTFKGGTVLAVDASIAEKSGSTGRLTIDGANTSLVISDSLGIGGSPTNSGGNGAIRLVNGGALDVRGTLKIWTSGTLDLAGGAVTVASLNLDGGRIIGAGALTLDATNGDAQINVTSTNPTVNATTSLADNTVVTVTPPASILSFTGELNASGRNLTKAGAGILRVNNVRAAGLSVNGGTVTIAPNGGPAATSMLGALSIAGGAAPTATFDLTNNAAVIDYSGTSPVATVRQQILSGRGGLGGGGTWTGTGITSSTAATANQTEPDSRSLGYAENATLPLGPYTIFHGTPVDNTSILIAYTRTGDANLDGVVNDDDVTVVGTFYAPGISKPEWAKGDFDYNGFVDDDDVTLLGLFYNPSALPLGTFSEPTDAQNVAAIPEPAGVVLMCVGMLGLALACHTAGTCSWPRFSSSG